MFPQYDLEKIKFGTDKATFKRGVELYEKGKVHQFEDFMHGFSGIVVGTKPYHVFVSVRHYDRGSCDCYLGQRGILCKHMIALAIYAIKRGQLLSEEEKQTFEEPKCSGRLGELTKEELSKVKKEITSALRYIKAYTGPSKIWFTYQSSLSEGCRRLSAVISKLPVSEQTAKLLVDLLLRLDKKLAVGGVDDSDGTVGNLICQTAGVLKEYAELDPLCIKAFKKLYGQKTCFEWEEELVELFNKSEFA